MDDLYQENWEALAAAIIEEACKDYAKALRYVRKWARASLHGKRLSENAKHHALSSLHTIWECEEFFRDGIDYYSNLDGKRIRNELLRRSGVRPEMIEELIKGYIGGK